MTVEVNKIVNTNNIVLINPCTELVNEKFQVKMTQCHVFTENERKLKNIVYLKTAV